MTNIKVLANFSNTIKDVIQLACNFWELDISSSIMIDFDHSITIPADMSILSIYQLKGGKNMIELKMINKYNNIFNILTSHERSIRLDRNEKIDNSKEYFSRNKWFQKDIKINKINEKKLENATESFITKFPVMLDYINIDNFDAINTKVREQKPEKPKTHQRGPIAFYLLICVITLQLFQLSHFEVRSIYTLRSSLINLFYISPGKNQLKSITYFKDITSRSDFKDWLEDMTSNIYISKNTHQMPQNFFSEKCVFLGDPLLIKFDTQPIEGQPRAYFISYKEGTIDKRDQKSPSGDLYPWGKYRTKSDIGLNYILSGYLSDYSEGGHAIELGLEKIPLENIQKRLKNINKFLSFNSLAANFVLGGYILDIDYFFSINLAIEKTPSGGYQPIMKEVEVFRPHLYWNYNINFYVDIMTAILTLAQILIHILNILRKLRSGKLTKYCKQINFFLSTIFMFTQANYYYHFLISYIANNGINLLTSKKFIDIRHSAQTFKNMIRFKAINIGVAILIMSVILNHKITQKFSINILNVAIAKNVQYLLLILPVFIGLALVGGFVFGPYNEDYTNFSKAIISVMLFTIGRIGKYNKLPCYKKGIYLIILAPGKILKYEATVGFIFITLFYLIAIFLSFTVFISFGLQSYNDVMANTGYYSASFRESTLKGKLLPI